MSGYSHSAFISQNPLKYKSYNIVSVAFLCLLLLCYFDNLFDITAIVSIVSLSMITIREISAEDTIEITVLSKQLGYSISEQQALQNINALKQSLNDKVFVAVDEQKVIGWMGVSYKISLESSPLCEIHGLVVHEQYRSRGIGKMLIEKAKQWSINKEVNQLRLRCNTKRTESLLFYQKIGFIEVKQQKVLEIKLDSKLHLF